MTKPFAAKTFALLLAMLLVCCTLAIAPAAAGTNAEYDISYSKKAPTIDGEISPNEYGRYSIVSWTLDDGDAEGFNKNLYQLTDDPNLAIDFYATWTNDDLYLAWKVTTKYDFRLPQDKTDNYMYENCCVQFIITPGAPDNSVKKYQTSEWAGDYLEIGICLRDDGESYKCCWSQPVAANNGLTLSDWEATARRDGETTVYECRIPWGKSGIESKGDNAKFGLTFGVGVQEDYNKTPGMIEWQDAILGGKNADNCAVMTLSGSGNGQQGVDIDVNSKDKAPVGELPDGLEEGLLTIDLFDGSITEGKSSIIFDASTVAQYNAKYAIAILLRPEDASKLDGYYTVVETIKGSGSDPVFSDIQKGDICLLVHADQTSTAEATARYNAAAEVTVDQRCYLHGFEKSSDGKVSWKYKNAQLVPIGSSSGDVSGDVSDEVSSETSSEVSEESSAEPVSEASSEASSKTESTKTPVSSEAPAEDGGLSTATIVIIVIVCVVVVAAVVAAIIIMRKKKA